MAALATVTENALLNLILRNTAYTPTATVYLALYTTNPTASDTGTEVVGGSYTRQVVTFSAASGGTCVNSADVNFVGMPSCTITHVGVRTASTAGTLLYYGALSSARTITAGDTTTVKAGDLNCALA